MIKLTDTFYLDADDRQFMLIEWNGAMYFDKKQKKEIPKWTRMLYYSSFENVLEKVAMILQRRGIAKSTTLVEVRDEFIKTKQIIEELAKQMNPTYKDASSAPL